MQPPQAFIDRMTAYDRELVVGWNERLGFKAPLGRWVIGRHRMLGEGIAHVMTVQTPAGHYMALGDHVLTHLRKIDSWRVGHNQQQHDFENMWKAEDEATDKELDEKIEGYIEKMRWALNRDTGDWNLAHVDKADMIQAEAGVERKLIEIATR